MSERTEKRGGAGCAIMCAIGILLPVLYLLGMGPAAWLSMRLPFCADLLTFIYAPVAYLSNNFVPVRRVVSWYIHLWIT